MDGSYMWSNTGRHEPIKEKIIEEEERKMRIGLQKMTPGVTASQHNMAGLDVHRCMPQICGYLIDNMDFTKAR